MARKKDELSLGPEIVQMILPQRRPFLMVDRIEAYKREPQGYVECSRCLSINEPFFGGHFPQVAVFPGALMLEGLCQASQILCTMTLYQRGMEEQGYDPSLLLEGLRNMERGFRLEPGYQADLAEASLELTRKLRSGNLGMTASTQIKFLHPVFAGEQVFYTSRLQKHIGDMWRFDVEAEVRDKVVAKGTVTSVVVQHAAVSTLLAEIHKL
ncbi:MAG: beta-hydroxyacyl-ACP dehydratase [Myxococcales bacterium]|nr:beta-hydroxyacyl-ACP dehydratase [Myxococcales bacterium]